MSNCRPLYVDASPLAPSFCVLLAYANEVHGTNFPERIDVTIGPHCRTAGHRLIDARAKVYERADHDGGVLVLPLMLHTRDKLITQPSGCPHGLDVSRSLLYTCS